MRAVRDGLFGLRKRLSAHLSQPSFSAAEACGVDAVSYFFMLKR